MAELGLRQLSSAFSSPTFSNSGSFRVDKPVGSMSISACGRDVVLASRLGLHIIDLDSPYAPPRHLPHHTPWEVADVQWSPFPSRDYWVISTSNQKALVWNLAMATPHASIEFVLHAHTRAITDINFSAHHPDVLATCAVDSFVHCWDLRRPEKPAITFCDWFAGATQVKWNRQDPHVIVSSHDKFLRIWDDRKGAYPLRSIEAHDTKIYGVDWNRTQSTCVVTCSLDKTIKFWNYANESGEPERIIRTPFPVWRARHTPFGWGLLAMPQRGDNDLYLYDRRENDDKEHDEHVPPVHRFGGHQSQVKEFLWRPRGQIQEGHDHREFQLVSWGTDRFLRLHRVDEKLLRDVGYVKGREVNKKFNQTRKNATYKTFREEPTKTAKTMMNIPSLSSDYQSDKADRREPTTRGGETMSTAPPLWSNGWKHGDFLNSRPGMRYRGAARVDVDPIAWMKGVKIEKQDDTSYDNGTSTMSLNMRIDGGWDNFENLGEEIADAGAKFSKVDFHKIDVQRRILNMSMYGPWGLNGTSAYIECRLEFPDGYPIEAVPSFSVEKTTTLDNSTILRLRTDVAAIGSAYLSQHRASLEALIRYLQGEQSMEEIIAWTAEEPDNSTLELPGADDSSSEDDDEVGGFTRMRVSDLTMGGSGIISSSTANANVPLPKACGAVWAKNGLLICFFPPKDDNPQTLLGTIGLDGVTILTKGGRKSFEGFGKFHLGPLKGKSKLFALRGVGSDSSATDTSSDDSDSSSGNTYSSTMELGSPRRHLHPPYAVQLDSFHLPRALNLVDESQKSNGSLSITKSRTRSSKSVVSILNLDSLLPTKRSLAKLYSLAGRDACRHNAHSASDEGHNDIADVWTLMDMILRNEVPIEVVNSTRHSFPLVVVKRRTLGPLQPTDDAGNMDDTVNLSFDQELTYSLLEARSPIKWGQHPLGSSHLIGSLFSYFERMMDMQMLAMMSLVFSQHDISTSVKEHLKHVRLKTKHLGPANTADHHRSSLPQYPRTQQECYFPSYEVASSLISAPPLTTSLASSLETPKSDSLPSYSAARITPPLSQKVGRKGFDRVDPSNQNLAVSPEKLKYSQRSNSNLASAFAASFPRSFSFTTSASSSPPNPHSKQQTSPVGSVQVPNMTWSSLSVFGRSTSAMEENQTPKSLEGGQKSSHQVSSQRGRIGIRLKNQDLFQEEGYSFVHLLDTTKQSNYRRYIEAYAQMLHIWELPIVKAEILKYSQRFRPTSTKALVDKDNSIIPLGRLNADVALKAIRPVLSLDKHYLEPLHANMVNNELGLLRHPARRRKSVPLFCVFCTEQVRGRAVPCLECGHVLHTVCRFLINHEPRLTGSTCITSCDCSCNKHLVVAVEWPKIPEKTPFLTLGIQNEAKEENLQKSQENTWEDVAYESLAKNLGVIGARYVKSKPSQIWRGKETRKGSAKAR